MFGIKILSILLLGVVRTSNDSESMVDKGVDKQATTSSDNGSMVDTGLNVYRYNLTTNCSVYVSASDIETYHRVVATATKLVYVQFHCNGTKWDVIKVLDEKSKYLLALGDYETYLIFSLHTLSSGIEHTSVRLHQLSEGCLIKRKDLNRTLMMLVSTNFQTLCKDGQCWENVCIKGTVTQCAVKDNGEYTLKEVTLNHAVALIVLISLIYITIAWILILEILSFTFLPPHTEYHYSQNNDFSILDHNTYLIGKEQVPSGIFSSCLSFLVQVIIPLESWLLKNRIKMKSIQRWVLLSIFIIILYLFGGYYFHHHTFPYFLYPSSKYIIFLTFVVLVPQLLIITILKYCFPDGLRSKRIYFPIGVIFPKTSKVLSKFLAEWKSSQDQNNKTRRCFTFSDKISFAIYIICICMCPCITNFIIDHLFNTLIGITTNSIPIFPLVMAGIVYYLKLSTRLSNWYKRFFEIVLDNVKSMADENVNEALQLLEKNSFHIVKSGPPVPKNGQLKATGTPMSFFHECIKLSIKHSRDNLLFEIVLDNVKSMADENVNEALQLSGKNTFHIVKSGPPVPKNGQLKVTGTPIFIDETGSVMITRSFFHECIKLSIKHSRDNPLRLLMKCVFKFYCVIILLFLIALIIDQFGMAGQQSTAHLSLVSLASGIIPLALYFLEDDSIPIEDSDTLFKKHLKDLVNSYEEYFTEAPQCNENIKGNNLTEQNGSELTTVCTMQFSSDEQEHTVESSKSMTENTEEGDASMNSRDVIIDIENEDESQEINTELPDDLRYIDIK